VFGLINQAKLHGDFFWDFDSLISFDQLDHSYLRLEISQMLADTPSWACAESHKGIGIESFTLLLPSLWSKLLGILEIFWAEVIACGLIKSYRILPDGDV
jgi:hypothetical protein